MYLVFYRAYIFARKHSVENKSLKTLQRRFTKKNVNVFLLPEPYELHTWPRTPVPRLQFYEVLHKNMFFPAFFIIQTKEVWPHGSSENASSAAAHCADSGSVANQSSSSWRSSRLDLIRSIRSNDATLSRIRSFLKIRDKLCEIRIIPSISSNPCAPKSSYYIKRWNLKKNEPRQESTADIT